MSYTVLVTVNAVGDFLSPLILFKGAHFYAEWCIGGYEKAIYSVSKSGWMEEEIFKSWLKVIFVTHCNLRPNKKKLLIFDRHGSHFSLELVNLAIENNIIIICLPPHSSATLQPLDRGVFKGMKKDLRSLVARFFLKNNFNSIDKINFSKLMKDLFEEFYRKEHVLSGFKATGIFPLDPQVVLGNEKV